MNRYFGEFNSINDLYKEFYIDESTIKDEEIVYASYDLGSYDGDSLVIFIRDGKLFEMNSSHCSCNGLEWNEPTITNIEALNKRQCLPEEMIAVLSYCKNVEDLCKKIGIYNDLS
ncbi:MAG: hypothetical protein LC122_02480 [Chitinophagales bacterium]|nr:hypothetical protein [Chitinophagales bacterium]